MKEKSNPDVPFREYPAGERIYGEGDEYIPERPPERHAQVGRNGIGPLQPV